jgi:plastocyanin
MLRRVRIGTGVLVLAGAVLFVAFGGGGGSAGPGPSGSSGSSVSSSSSTGTSISISNFMYSPMTLSVKPGATISVTNKDSATHTLTASGPGGFNTGNISHNQTKTFTAPTKPGTYQYICNIHQYMMGTIKVS